MSGFRNWHEHNGTPRVILPRAGAGDVLKKWTTDFGCAGCCALQKNQIGERETPRAPPLLWGGFVAEANAAF